MVCNEIHLEIVDISEAVFFRNVMPEDSNRVNALDCDRDSPGLIGRWFQGNRII